MTRDALLKKRDEHVRQHLEQYAPVWLVNNQILEVDQAVIFNVVFRHPEYGYVNRRYKYDGFNNVLYHKGQVVITEETALEVMEAEPFITVSVSDVPNAYGG
jgi:hypothetical protein